MKRDQLWKEFLKYVSLNVMGMIGLSCYILADTFFVAKGLKTNGLAALNLAISIYSFIHGTGLMIGIGGATRYTILKAKENHEEANKVFTLSVLFGLAVGVVYLLIGVFFSGTLSTLLGANEATYALTKTYLTTILCFAPFFIMNNVIIAFVRNDGAPGLSMSGMLLGSLSNIILDYVFIFPLGMGMFGAAFATGLAPIVSMCVMSPHFIKKKNNFHLTKAIGKLSAIKNIVSLGATSFITEVSSGIVIIVFNITILSLEGNTGVAAYGVVANVALVVLSIFNGISQGMQPIISRHYGLGNSRSISKIFRYGMISAFVLAVIINICAWLFDTNLVSAFNSENDRVLQEIAVNGIHLYFIGFLFAGLNIVCASFFSSIEKPAQGFSVSLIRGFLAIIPAVLLLSRFFGMNGVWLSFPAAEGAALLFAGFALLKNPITVKRVLKRNQA